MTRNHQYTDLNGGHFLVGVVNAGEVLSATSRTINNGDSSSAYSN